MFKIDKALLEKLEGNMETVAVKIDKLKDQIRKQRKKCRKR